MPHDGVANGYWQRQDRERQRDVKRRATPEQQQGHAVDGRKSPPPCPKQQDRSPAVESTEHGRDEQDVNPDRLAGPEPDPRLV